MALGQGILAGKKTYVVAGLGILTAIASYLTGELALAETIQGIFVAIGAMTLRAGIAKTGTNE